MPHPLRVTAGQIIVHRHQPHILPGERVQIQRQSRHQRLTLTRLHLGDLPLVQHDAADELHIKRHHVPDQLMSAHLARRATQPPTGVFDDSKSLA